MDNTFTIEDGVLVKYGGPGGNVAVPEGVRAIGQGAFLNCTALRSVTIPQGVEEIRGDFFSEQPSGAFSGCTGLSSVQLPDSLREIGCWAFSGCTGLKNVEIPRKVERIGNRAFQDCTGLKSMVIPEGVREMDYGVFMGCTGLKSVELPRSVSVIREYAFADCAAMERIVLPSGVRTIDFCAFRNCASLKSAAIPAATTELGEYAFENCGELLSVSIGENVEKIGENAFSNCPKLTVRTRKDCPAERYAREREIPVVTYEQLKDAAGAMMERAYVPYSRFPVGAALECEDGAVFTGCNVENAVYPAGICAERNAVFHAVSQGKTRFSRIVIASQGKDFCVPCGICRQAMAEFSPDMEVVCLNSAGDEERFFLRDLLPHGFGPKNLEKD